MCDVDNNRLANIPYIHIFKCEPKFMNIWHFPAGAIADNSIYNSIEIKEICAYVHTNLHAHIYKYM